MNQDRAQRRFDRDEDVVEDQVANDRDKIKGKVQKKIDEAKSTRRFADGRTR
ncbi:MAG: hypothetical protein AABZ33_12090 [Chloroflexota bacterium]|mgnify:CR=1 FL=1